MNPTTQKNSIRQLVDELHAATAAAKCHPCGCFHGALNQLARALPAAPAQAQAELRAALDAGVTRTAPEEYPCLGCAVCWPANALNIAAQAFPEADLSGDAACPTDAPAPEHRWPPLPGNYRVLDQAGTAAVCVLTSEALLDVLETAHPPGVAIVGALYTENLGIERLITNTLANPNLTTLLVCGADSRQRIGHLPGQTLLTLVAHGVDERRRIIDARGRRPILKNLSLESIAAFRREITVVDRIGEENPTTLLELLHSLPSHEGPRRTLESDGQSLAPIRAQPPARLVLDPRGYFILFPDRGRGVIRVEHYEINGQVAHVFEGERSEELYSTIIAHDLVSCLDHAAYLGMELARAERALLNGEPYVQDQAPEPPCRHGCGCS